MDSLGFLDVKSDQVGSDVQRLKLDGRNATSVADPAGYMAPAWEAPGRTRLCGRGRKIVFGYDAEDLLSPP
jgi:hypothetical protein